MLYNHRNIVSVIVEDPIVSKNFVLLTSPLDLSSKINIPEISDNIKSVLLYNGKLIEKTKNNFGYKVGFYLSEDPRKKNYAIKSLYGYDRMKDKILNPFVGVIISTNLGNFKTFTKKNGFYDLYYYIPPCPGFSITYFASMYVDLNYIDFNPKGKNVGKYFERYQFDETCSGLSEISQYNFTYLGVMQTLANKAIDLQSEGQPKNKTNFPIDVGMITGRAVFSNPDETIRLSMAETTYFYTSVQSNLITPLYDMDGDSVDDVINIVGKNDKPITMTTDFSNHINYTRALKELSENPFNYTNVINEFFGIDINDYTSIIEDTVNIGEPFNYTRLIDELLSNNFNDYTSTNENPYTSIYPEINFYSERSDFQNYSPFLTRRQDETVNFSNEGLLKYISEEDLKNTDIYVIRMSNNQLIMAREGLKPEESTGYHGTSIHEERPIINFRLIFRTPLAFLNHPSSFERWQSKTNIHPDFHKKQADHLRMGEKVRIIIINRATGYMGSKILTYGSGQYNLALNQSLISLSIEKINLHPPNLKIYAERYYESDESTLTSNDQIYSNDKKSIIGFEGSALVSDKFVTITTDWVALDGYPLPETLPGFTGRLSKIVGKNHLNKICNFEIRPGRNMQVIQLPSNELDAGHYYVHVNAEPMDGSPPDFSTKADFETLGAGNGALEYRPKHYVPIKVPIFDENQTKDNVSKAIMGEKLAYQKNSQHQLSLKDIKRSYQWKYRPEYQFSLFNFNPKSISYETSFDEKTKSVVTSLNVEYKLLSDPLLDPLERIGFEREFFFGCGYDEFLAPTGEDNVIEYTDVEKAMFFISKMTSEDYLTFQLYQADDVGNDLYVGFPLVVANWQPFQLKRTWNLSKFDSSKDEVIQYTDDYKLFTFYNTKKSTVSLTLYDKTKENNIIIISDQILNKGMYSFVIDFETVLNDLKSISSDPETSSDIKFYIELKINSVDKIDTQNIVVIKGRLVEDRRGLMTGQIMAHDVLIQDGSLNLFRKDFAIAGRGPDLSFSRSYNNQSPGDSDSVLGPGWNHQYNTKLYPLSSQKNFSGKVPSWVKTRSKSFMKYDTIPKKQDEDTGEWTLVYVNGTVFKKEASSNEWFPQFGKHGNLTIKATYTQPNRSNTNKSPEPYPKNNSKLQKMFIYTSKEGVKYTYLYPERFDEYSNDYHIRIEDSLIYRICYEPKHLHLGSSGETNPTKTLYSGYPYSNLLSIKDRNDNTLSFSYDDEDKLSTVVDAVDRQLKFSYMQIKDPFFGDAMRLSGISSVDNIAINFIYDANGYLSTAKRSTHVESYSYQKEPDSENNAFNLIKTIDANGYGFTYTYYDIDSEELNFGISSFLSGLKKQDMVKEVYYPGLQKPVEIKYIVSQDKNIRQINDLKGNDTIYLLNEFGNPKRIIEPTDQNNENRCIVMEWLIDDEEANDNVLKSKTDARGFRTSYVYNEDGNIKLEIDPYGNTITTTWNNNSLPTYRKDKNGVEQFWNYDSKGNLLEYKIKKKLITVDDIQVDNESNDNGTIVQQFEYNTFGELRRKWDGNNTNKEAQNATQFTYDQYGNPDITTFPHVEGMETVQINEDYDIRGRKINSKDPNGNAIYYSYNELDKLKTTTYPTIRHYEMPDKSRIERKTYDEMGNLTSETNKMGLKLSYLYTPRKQIKSIIRSIGGKKQFEYDENGNLISEKDWNGIITCYEYDNLNRQISIIKPKILSDSDTDKISGLTCDDLIQNSNKATIIEKHYDLANNLIKIKDANDHVEEYQYDKLNRQTHVWKSINNDQKSCSDDNRSACVHIQMEYYNGSDQQTNLKSFIEPSSNGLTRTTIYAYNERYLKRIQKNAMGNYSQTFYDNNSNVINVIDEEFNRIDYSYDNHNRMRETIQYLKTEEADSTETKITTYQDFDKNGNLERTYVTDKNHPDIIYNETEMIYDAWNQVYKTTTKDNTSDTPEHYITITEYDGGGNIVKQIDPNGRIRKWKRDKRGLVEQEIIIKDSGEELINKIYAYDDNGNIDLETDARGIKTKYYYDEENRLIKQTEAILTVNQRTKKMIRDNNGNPTDITDYLGHTTHITYNGLNLPTSKCDPKPFEEQCDYITYYKTGKTYKTTNKLGLITTYEYDLLNRETKITEQLSDSLSYSITKTYDKVGNITLETNKRGIATEYKYDSLYRVIDTIKSGISIAKNKYDAVGNKVSVIDAMQNKTEMRYNSLNLVSTIINPEIYPGQSEEERKIEKDYDSVGNLKQLINEEKKVSTYSYDEENREISMEFAGEITRNIYDESGNHIAVVKPKGNCRVMIYDELNRLSKVIDNPDIPKIDNSDLAVFSNSIQQQLAEFCHFNENNSQSDNLQLITRYEYDLNDNLKHQYDPNNNHVQFEYDELNRKAQTIQHKENNTKLITFYKKYDAQGNLKELLDPDSQSDPNSKIIKYSYDKLGRLIKSEYPNSEENNIYIPKIIEREYDENNNIKVVTETKISADNKTLTDITTYTYDPFDRLKATNQRDFITHYAYDVNGNRTYIITSPKTAESSATSYSYNSRNWLEKVFINGESETSYSYYDDGKKKEIIYPNQTGIKYKYDNANRIETITNINYQQSKAISRLSYTYDQNGNRTQQIEYQCALSGSKELTETTSYNYDILDRMTSYTLISNADTIQTTYTYQGYNRKTEKIIKNGQQSKFRTYQYDKTNWLTDITEQSDTDSPTKTIHYTYDKNGNTIKKIDSSLSYENHYLYNSRDQLVLVTRGPPDNKDYLGQYDYDYNGMRIRHFNSNSERGNINYYYDGTAIIEEKQNKEKPSFFARYHYSDRLICLQQIDSNQYYHHDALGSTIHLSDESGEVKIKYTLDPWGTIRKKIGNSINRHVFTGQEHDEQTGLIYFGARYYDAEIARFYSTDNYIGDINNPPSLHKYQYAYQNPTVYVDPNGNVAVAAILLTVGAYLIKAGVETVIETEIEEKISTYMGNEDFDYGRAFGKNMLINIAINWIPGAVEYKIGSKVAKYSSKLFIKGGAEALEHLIETSIDTAYDVNKYGGNWKDHYYKNSISNIIGRGIGSGAKKVLSGIDSFVKKIFKKNKVVDTVLDVSESATHKNKINPDLLNRFKEWKIFKKKKKIVDEYNKFNMKRFVRSFRKRKSSSYLNSVLNFETNTKKSIFKDANKEIHHFFTNKNKQYTKKFNEYFKKYGLSLDDPFNKVYIRHKGSHPSKLWDLMYHRIKRADRYAKGDARLFTTYLQKNIFNTIIQNPDILYKQFWDSMKRKKIAFWKSQLK